MATTNTTKAPPTSVILAAVRSELSRRIPERWSVVAEEQPILGSERLRPDMILTLSAPDGRSVAVVVEVKSPSNVRAIDSAALQLASYLRAHGESAVGLVAAPYVSPSARERLRREGIGFADLTGNVWLASDEPAFFISSSGKDRNPYPKPSSIASLKGPAAGAAVRALVDFAPPYGIRDLSARADVSAPTLSRVVGLLDDEGLIDRSSDGGVQSVDWVGAIRRWTQDYQVLRSNAQADFLAPRGFDPLLDRLRAESDALITGSLAIPPALSIAPPRLAMIYTRDVSGIADRLDLRRVERGANVILLEPGAPFVFDRRRVEDGLPLAALSQVAADLLTSPGRGPNEAEELLEWMAGDEDAWRA